MVLQLQFQIYILEVLRYWRLFAPPYSRLLGLEVRVYALARISVIYGSHEAIKYKSSVQQFNFFKLHLLRLIVGNLLTVVALLRCPKLRSRATTMFVISLSMSDLMFSAINLPLTATRYILEDWELGITMCK